MEMKLLENVQPGHQPMAGPAMRQQELQGVDKPMAQNQRTHVGIAVLPFLVLTLSLCPPQQDGEGNQTFFTGLWGRITWVIHRMVPSTGLGSTVAQMFASWDYLSLLNMRITLDDVCENKCWL